MVISGLKQPIWEEMAILNRFEEERAVKRKQKGRLSFDCLHLKCKGSRACCSEGHILGQAKDGSMYLLTVLRGGTSGVCVLCADFITEEE